MKKRSKKINKTKYTSPVQVIEPVALLIEKLEEKYGLDIRYNIDKILKK